MSELFASERSIDLVLLLIALEAVILMVLWRMRSCPLRPLETLLILAPGTLLLLSSRAVMSGAAGTWVPSLFLAALIMHLLDLRRQWRDRQRQDPILLAPLVPHMIDLRRQRRNRKRQDPK
jgi:hypothetical protein